eukprot:a509379_51.p2 GENE.a509379_51~~a509379_51.p2  ORF type:complete len:178 (+),score=53.15 a509379_51:37-534(+)
MATRTFASAVFPLPMDTVWAAVRDFTFPGRMISTVESCELVGPAGPTCVGAVRVVRWKTGEERTHRLLELNDLLHVVSWEMIGANHPTETMSVISTLRCFRITEDNSTLVEWAADFSSDVVGDVLRFEQQAYADSLEEMRNVLVALHEDQAAPLMDPTACGSASS